MGEAELHRNSGEYIIQSHFVFYGDASSADFSKQIAKDISDHWNEPRAIIRLQSGTYRLIFQISASHEPDLDPEKVWYNTDPKQNFFRIEEFSNSHISFVDGLGSNTGYFKLDNLLHNSTTAAHEYGHTLGLEHPEVLDIRGKGQPGIMYPRGTICDPQFQYDINALPLQPGGTLNPYTRKVLQSDIDDLRLDRVRLDNQGKGVIGEFTSLFHQKHHQLL